MALDLSPDEKLYGQANFANVSQDLTRRGFMKSLVVAGGAVAVAGSAAYFGYQKMGGKPIKVAMIGTGDEGGVLIGEHNPEYLEIVAISDIRPTQVERAYTGDPNVPLRKGLKFHYGNDCAKSIKSYPDYKQMLNSEKEIDAVIIATPLLSHAPIAIDCMKAGKDRGRPIHVLCEKLMARTIGQCKQMIKTAEDCDSILSIGHQRHYSMLYAHAVEVLNTGILGDIKHIRALWHRNFSWPLMEGGKWAINDKGEPVFEGQKQVKDPATHLSMLRDGWMRKIPEKDREALNDSVQKYGYKDVEELIRWRLYNRTGGGLMAELGGHQLDACSIFLGKVHPIAVSGVGTHCFYGTKPGDGKPNPREIDDHVFTTYEFPGKHYYERDNDGKLVMKDGKPVVKDPSDVCVVTYSSISTNEFEPYGECVMGTRGTLLVEKEQNAFLFSERDPNKKGSGPSRGSQASVVTVGGNKPAMDAGPTWGGPAVAATKTGSSAAVSRGYREEMEDFAYCVKLWSETDKSNRRQPRCHGRVAMADAIIALTSNLSMKHRKRIEFADAWFQSESDAVPDKEIEAMLA